MYTHCNYVDKHSKGHWQTEMVKFFTGLLCLKSLTCTRQNDGYYKNEIVKTELVAQEGYIQRL